MIANLEPRQRPLLGSPVLCDKTQTDRAARNPQVQSMGTPRSGLRGRIGLGGAVRRLVDEIGYPPVFAPR
jgi:hypothetical protein